MQQKAIVILIGAVVIAASLAALTSGDVALIVAGIVGLAIGGLAITRGLK